MNKFFQEYLFAKHILVGSPNSDAVINVAYLAKVFNIKVTQGKSLVNKDTVAFAASQLGQSVPAPFYQSFPDSVRKLSQFELLADQIIHYIHTYGMNNFAGDASHSIFEEQIEKKLFNEKTPAKQFVVLSLDQANDKLVEIFNNLLTSSRAWNDTDYNFVYKMLLNDKVESLSTISSKFNAIKLAYDFYTKVDNPIWILDIIKSINITDLPKILDYLYQLPNKLKLKNRDRAFFKFLLNQYVEDITVQQLSIMFEKRQVWKNLLHYLHYFNEKLEPLFVSKKNLSAYSSFEKQITKDAVKAGQILKQAKGNGAILRKLNFLISRCKTKSQISKVLNLIDDKNVIILIQLLLQYQHYDQSKPRTFKFIKNNLQKVHTETKDEQESRKSQIKKSWLSTIIEVLNQKLSATLKNRVGKVYIDPEMKNIAIPLQMANANSGFGCLPSGSIVDLPKSKVFRLFTYWEKVNDIDLSSIGLAEDGEVFEFSWRTFFQHQNKAITFSGDITNGYNGGSEYIDINVEEFKKKYPKIRYLIMCDNVFTGTGFNNCICKAGYMVRNKLSSGEIFEPKTVQTSFNITAASNFCAMFALDLKTNQIIWLNLGIDTDGCYFGGRVAATQNMDYLKQYFDITKQFSVKNIFTLSASKVVQSPAQADLVVSDKNIKLGKSQEQIHSYDFEKIFKILK